MPRVISAAKLGLHVENRFGELGPESYVTGHHTAGAVDRDDAHAIQLVRQYHADHKAKGWGGIGYHYAITRRGTILCLRSTYLLGAHVGLHNSGNVGVMFFGTVGDTPSRRQRRAFRYLLRKAHTKRFPRLHRTDRKLLGLRVVGHNDWSGHTSNACPGTFKPMIVSKGKRR